MPNTLTGAAQYLTRFGDQTIVGNQYALAKLGVENSQCSLKIEEYLILCVPYQLGFKRSILMASLSKQEVSFFLRYVNGIVGFSIALNPGKRPEPMKFFLRCTLNTVGQMKGRENVGLFVVDYKTTPDEMVKLFGNYLEAQEKYKTQYEDYGNTSIKMTPDTAKILGYNMFATITEAGRETKRIQVFNFNSKTLEYMEAAGSPVRAQGAVVTHQLFFKKFRITVQGTVLSASVLPQGIVRTSSSLDFSPELVEIIDEYWYNSRTNQPVNLLA